MVGPFDPGHDRDAQLLTSGPGAAVEDVFLQQAEERFHRGVVTAGSDSAHRSDHAVAGQGAQELPASKLRSSVRMHHTSGDVTAHRNSVVQCVDGQARLHS